MGLLLACALGAVSASPPVIPLYHASYSVARNDIRIGVAQFTLTRNSDGSYTYQSVTKPTGLLALFLSDVVTETSHFTLVDGAPRPLLYSYLHTGSNSDKPQNIQFDWSKRSAYSGNGGTYHTLPLEAGIYDRLLAQLAISLDAAQGHLNNDYRVLDHGELQTFRLQQAGGFEISTPAGQYKTIKVVRHDQKKDRVTSFWLAPKLDYLPVQMEQTQPGKATISLVLMDFSFDEPH